MTVLTEAFIRATAVLAGADYAWSGIGGTSRPAGAATKKKDGTPRHNGATPRQGMAVWLFNAQSGLCPTCGQGMTLAWVRGMCTLDIAHVVGAGSGRKGYLPGNVFLSHPGCNVETARAHGAVTDEDAYHVTLTLADFQRADLVPMEWPFATVGKFVTFSPLY